MKRLWRSRKIFFGTLILVIGFGLLLALQRPHVIDVSKDYENSGVFGRTFKTKADLLVAQYPKSKDWILEKPGADMPKMDGLPQKFPFSWYGNEIYGVLPAGSQFKIVGAKRSTSKTLGHDWFMVESQSDGPFKGKVVSTSRIERGESYDPNFAEEVGHGK